MDHKKTDKDWKRILTPEQYKILREKGTEPAFTGKYVDHHEDGIYLCMACKKPLFESNTKFESGSGWPSFYDVVEKGNVELVDDSSFGMSRTEVKCKNCGGHLGHVFDDLPAGRQVDKDGNKRKRYCINSCSLDFKKK